MNLLIKSSRFIQTCSTKKQNNLVTTGEVTMKRNDAKEFETSTTKEPIQNIATTGKDKNKKHCHNTLNTRRKLQPQTTTEKEFQTL